mgnify:CR=1 FL=1
MDTRTRINVRTSDEIDTWLFHLEKVCFRAGIRFKGKKLTKEAIVNALMANASALDESAVLRMVSDGTKVYETQLEKMAVVPAIKS